MTIKASKGRTYPTETTVTLTRTQRRRNPGYDSLDNNKSINNITHITQESPLHERGKTFLRKGVNTVTSCTLVLVTVKQLTKLT